MGPSLRPLAHLFAATDLGAFEHLALSLQRSRLVLRFGQ